MLIVILAAPGCAATGGSPVPEDPPQELTALPNEQSAVPAADEESNLEPDEDGYLPSMRAGLLDQSQDVVSSVVNNTAFWFDGLFAGVELERQAELPRGRLSLGARWDERDGLKKRPRFRVRVPLPALRQRVGMIVGHTDSDNLLDGSESSEIKDIPDKFNDTGDEDWFLGLGYRQRYGLARGFDAGVGVAFTGGKLQPYVQANYRWNRKFGEDWLLRVRPRIFWRDDRGRGASLTTILDYFVSRDWLLRSWNVLVTQRNTDGVRWTGKLLAYQSLEGRSAFSYNVFVTGQTDSEIDVEDYGFEVRFRRRLLREWLYLELSTGVSWPRFLVEETRESNFAVGAELEMRFGYD